MNPRRASFLALIEPDLRNAKLTLPLIHALRVLTEPRKTSLLLALKKRRLTRSQLLQVLAASGSADYVLARISGYADRAVAALAGVRQTPMKAALLEVSTMIVREAAEQSAEGWGRDSKHNSSRLASGRMLSPYRIAAVAMDDLRLRIHDCTPIFPSQSSIINHQSSIQKECVP